MARNFFRNLTISQKNCAKVDSSFAIVYQINFQKWQKILKISPLWDQKLKSLWQYLRDFFRIWPNLEPTLAKNYVFGSSFIVAKGQSWKHNLSIWSHWTRDDLTSENLDIEFLFRFCEIKIKNLKMMTLLFFKFWISFSNFAAFGFIFYPSQTGCGNVQSKMGHFRPNKPMSGLKPRSSGVWSACFINTYRTTALEPMS